MRTGLSLRNAIRKVVEDVGDPLMDHIYSQVVVSHPGLWTHDEIRQAVLGMVNAGILRMKDDDYDHDWTYRKGKNW